ncbi:MAG: hypothetical protein ACRCY3_03810 [Sphingorhabdus sp.]
MVAVIAIIFALAMIISAASILSFVNQWGRIKSVMANQGKAQRRIIRVGKIKNTGQRIRLVVVNEFDGEEQQVFNFADYKAAQG